MAIQFLTTMKTIYSNDFKTRKYFKHDCAL